MRKQCFIDQIVISVLNRKAINECSLGRWADREAVSYWLMRDPCHRGLHGLRFAPRQNKNRLQRGDPMRADRPEEMKKGDRWFESRSLQQSVCEPSVPQRGGAKNGDGVGRTFSPIRLSGTDWLWSAKRACVGVTGGTCHARGVVSKIGRHASASETFCLRQRASIAPRMARSAQRSEPNRPAGLAMSPSPLARMCRRRGAIPPQRAILSHPLGSRLHLIAQDCAIWSLEKVRVHGR